MGRLPCRPVFFVPPVSGESPDGDRPGLTADPTHLDDRASSKPAGRPCDSEQSQDE